MFDEDDRRSDGPPTVEPDVNVLLVDDRKEDLQALELVLASPGYNLVTASSGEDALRRLLSIDFAVILLDVVMPGMDGFEVAATIKRRERSRDTPILFLTSANQDMSAIYRAYSVGAMDYLVKPLDESVVRAKVAIFVELFRKDRRIQEQARALREADRRQRELEMAELRLLSERRYRSLVETIPASVWTADAGGAVDYCNRHWYELTGLSLGETRGDGWLSAVHAPDAERVDDQWRQAITGGQTYLTELRLSRRDGSHRWYICHAVPDKDRRGQVRGWLGMFTDCEELKRAIEARDEFLSVASHELRTPITTLMLQIESLSKRITDAQSEDRVGRKLDSALRQTHRLQRLVESLLDVARICGGRLQLDFEEVDLAEIARQSVEGCMDEASRGGAQLALACAPNIPGRWDPQRLEQVLTNLISNAIKYGAGRPIEVSVESDEQAVRLSVRDYGIGIEPAHQARIFERFERAVSSRNYGGLGMGLFITRQIVEAHGGSIAVESTPGQGSTFSVSLPRRCGSSVAA